MSTATTPRLHKLTEVALRTGIPLKTLQRGCRTRRFKHVNFSGRRYMTDEHIAAAVEEHTIGADLTPAVDPEVAEDFARVARMAAAN